MGSILHFGLVMRLSSVRYAFFRFSAIAACLIVSMIILSVCIAFALWRYHVKRKWLDEQKDFEEKTKLNKGPPAKPERYIYRGHESLPPRVAPPASQYSLFPNRYGSSGGLHYSTLPRPGASQRVSPAVSARSGVERSGLERSGLGTSSRSGLFVPPPSSMASSTHSVLSERSRLASMEDLTADEMDCEYR